MKHINTLCIVIITWHQFLFMFHVNISPQITITHYRKSFCKWNFPLWRKRTFTSQWIRFLRLLQRTTFANNALLTSVLLNDTLTNVDVPPVGRTSAKNGTNRLLRGEDVHSHCTYTFLIRDIKATWSTLKVARLDCSCSFRQTSRFVPPQSVRTRKHITEMSYFDRYVRFQMNVNRYLSFILF